jgi:hypothetical protein
MSEVHVAGQQPSPATQVVMGVWVQTRSQVALLPLAVTSVVQGLWSLQSVGQGSQVSPLSKTPLPHFGGQSESALVVLVLHPAGQQLSPATQAVMAVWVQTRVQVALLPLAVTSVVQALPSLQLVGQGSQVSPFSTTPLPHFGVQSESLLALHPVGQQPSPPIQAVMAVWLQATLQLALLPVM